MSEIKAPLTVYILWHPDFQDGDFYAKEIYSQFTRDIENPASRGIGIPILFPSNNKEFEHKLQINFDKTEKIAIVLFIDNKMLLDEQWHAYIEKIQEQCEGNPKYIIYPVAMCKNALKFSVKKIKEKNYIRLYEKFEKGQKENYLIFMLAHELCRFLYDIERISEIGCNQSPAPIKLFLSHAKEDGVKITDSIRMYIEHDTQLDDFFDTKDIATGYDFADEIKAAIPQCMLLVIHTDKYSSRDWCRKEILMSKEFSVPILILDCLDKQEDRSFPYMYNVQTLRINPQNVEMEKEEIVSIALKEVLRYKYQKLYINYVLCICGLTVSQKNILSYPPELFSLIKTINVKEKLVVYPDPPLSSVELELLKQCRQDLQFVTPTELHCIDNKDYKIRNKPFIKLKIGISISEATEENTLGLNRLHLQDAMVEIARYLLVGGAQLSYGGDVRYNNEFNFVDILKCLVENHNGEYEKIPQKLTNYVAHYLKKSVSEEIQADLIDVAIFKFIEPIGSIDYNNMGDELFGKYLKARDLSNMRKQMNDDINARIVLGGKKVGFQGAYPGILEEVILAMCSEKPVYLIGAYGGITQEIIKCITGQSSDVLTKQYQSSFNEYGIFYDYYNDIAKHEGIELIDYDNVTSILNNKGIKGLHNGLSCEENKVLFESTNIIEIISLILKGLSSCNKELN